MKSHATKPFLTLGVFLWLVACSGNGDSNLQQAQLDSTDASFIGGATQASNAEIAAGKLALSRSMNPAVLSFADEMIAAHTSENAALAPIASTNGVALPNNVNAAQAAVATELMPLRGSAFDKLYIDSEITGHQANLDGNYKPEIAHGTNANVRGYATKYVSQVESHLAMATTIAKQNGF